MPSTYAHYRFGKSVFTKLPASMQELIAENKALFYIGLHGPDILFYYRPLGKNPVSDAGHLMHSQAGLTFFSQAAEVVKAHGNAPAYLAYVYGVICHFALDRSCHGAVNRLAKELGISHTEVEVEFDRRLLVHDGYDPLRTSLVDHIHPGKKTTAVITGFYQQAGAEPLDLTKRQIGEAIRSFVIANRILRAPGRIKRGLLEKCLKLAGQEEHVGKMVISRNPNPLCKKSNEMLAGLYQKAVSEAVGLILDFADNMEGKKEWSSLYLDNFSSRRVAAERTGV